MSHKSTQPPRSEEPSAAEAPDPPVRRRGRLHGRLHANPALSLTTKLVVTTLGCLVLTAGLVMMVTPGPGLVGIALGLAILATEYDWADRWLVRAREKLHQARLNAAALDPRVRRRRIILAATAVLALAVLISVLVGIFGWPAFAVDGWSWLQGLAGWVPDLPGM